MGYPDLDLEFPIDDFVSEGSDQDLPSLLLVLWPTDDPRLLAAREPELLHKGPAVVIVLAE